MGHPIKMQSRNCSDKASRKRMSFKRARDCTVIGRNISASNNIMLERVQRAHFQYFLDFQDKTTGLILDRTRLDGPATIAGVGFALSAYGAASERRWVSRAEAADYTLRVLRNLWHVPQGDSSLGVNGYRGFFYHFLNPATGERATSPKFWNSELSTIDTALLMAGVRFARYFYLGKSAAEAEIRDLSDKLYNRVEWNWMVRNDGLILHGWSPEGGLIQNVYSGYSEAPLLYLLAMGSPTFPAPAASWNALLANPLIAHHEGLPYVSMPGQPLFCYQFPHCFIDFRGIRDRVNRVLGSDYFENSKRATLAQHAYASANPHKFRGYDAVTWGITASDGPGNCVKVVDGVERQFFWYCERGAPQGTDDGTIAPTAALSSIPFTPALSLRTMQRWLKDRPEIFGMHGFVDAFNPTFDTTSPSGWIDTDRIAIDQGPIVLMIENYRSGLIWKVMQRDPALRQALAKADFQLTKVSRQHAR